MHLKNQSANFLFPYSIVSKTKLIHNSRLTLSGVMHCRSSFLSIITHSNVSQLISCNGNQDKISVPNTVT